MWLIGAAVVVSVTAGLLLVRHARRCSRAEAILRESEERYRSVVEDQTELVCRYRGDGTLTFVNDAYCHFAGLPREELLACRFLSTFDESARAAAEAHVSSICPDNPTARLEHRLVTPGGTGRWHQWFTRGFFDRRGRLVEYQSVGRDVTEQKQTEERLREERDFSSAVLNTVGALVVVLDDSGGIVRFNRRCREVTGYTYEEAKGRALWDFLLVPDEIESVRAVFQELKAGDFPNTHENYWVTKDGRRRLITWSNTAIIGPDGAVEHIIGTGIDVTEQRQAEAALRASEDLLRNIIQATGEAMVAIDSGGRITLFNPAAEGMFGWTAEEMIGQPLDRMMPPSYREAHRKYVRRFFDTGKSSGGIGRLLELPGLRRDGGSFPMEVSLSEGRHGEEKLVIGVARDISERKRAEEALRASEQRFRLLADNVPGIIYLCKNDPRYTMLYLNDGVEAATGYPKERFLSDEISFADLYHSDDAPGIFRGVDEALAKKEPFRLSYRIKHANGEWRWLEEFGTGVWTDTGELLYLEGFISDITARVRAEEDRRKLEQQIQHAQKLESLGVLAGGIAHDFNNLLVGILGNAGLARLELPAKAPARQMIDHIEVAAQRAADLARQMLAYSGKGRFVVERVDLSRLVEEMAHLLNVSITKKAVLRFELSRDLPPIEADATQIRQVVMNLITNASDALGGASGVIAVRTGAMEADRAYLSDTYLDDHLEAGYYTFVEVADTGCGMDEPTLARIFDPFFTTKFTGRGLGLAAALGIVRGHNGALKVTSEPGRGTTFRVLFPCARSRADNVNGGEAGEAMSDQQWQGDGTILVADDEEIVRTVAKMTLERYGLNVLTAEDGEETLAVFRDHAAEIRAVILDMTMPKLSGEEVFREIRRIRPDVCVIVSSGYNEQDVVDSFRDDKPMGFIQKPYRAQDLVDRIREVLG